LGIELGNIIKSTGICEHERGPKRAAFVVYGQILWLGRFFMVKRLRESGTAASLLPASQLATSPLTAKLLAAKLLTAKQGAAIKNNKERGEWAELQFMARAAGMGFGVAKPWGESKPYDVGIEYGGRYIRVQVKSTINKVDNSYVCNTRPYRRERPYTIGQIDFLAAYVILVDVWYIIPARVAIKLEGNIWLSPHKKGHKYEQFMEAWDLLKDSRGR
jgi:PD-(D/E)XK endonuclease